MFQSLNPCNLYYITSLLKVAVSDNNNLQMQR